MKRGTILVCIPMAIYMTLLFYKFGVFQTIGQGCLICIYCLMVFVGMFLLVLRNKKGWHIKRGIIYASAILGALITLIFIGDSILLRFRQAAVINIIATNEKNEEAVAAEVWILGIEVDEKAIDLKTIQASGGWYYSMDADALIANPSNEEMIQTIEFGYVGKICINLMTHPWSGKVKINTGTQSDYIDLYDAAGSSYTYEVSGSVYQSKILDLFSVILAYSILFLLYLDICILCTRSIRFLLLLSILYTAFVFGNLEGIVNISYKALLCIMAGYALISNIGLNWYFKLKKLYRSLLFIVAALVAFLFFGSRMFILSQNYTLLQWGKFLGLVIWFVPCIAFVYRCFDELNGLLCKRNINAIIKEDKAHKKNKIAIFAFSMLLAIFFTNSIRQVFFVHYSENCKFSIIPLGEKNENSAGTEVLLGGISVNGLPYSPEVFKNLPDGWKIVNGMIMGLGNTPLEVNIPIEGAVEITFNQHAWSGIVQIEDGEKTEVIDLFVPIGSPNYIRTYVVSQNRGYDNTFFSYAILAVITVLLTVGIFGTLFLVKKIWEKQAGNRQFFYGVFLLELLVYAFYLLASYPAAICIDGRAQLNQALGYYELSDAHPILHTLLIKYLTFDGKYLVGISLAQSLSLALLSAFILNCLYKKGINGKILIIFGFASALMLNNGIYASTIWKDIPYSICLLWLTYLFYRMESDKGYIVKGRNMLVVIIALSAIRLLRHNGIVVLILACVLLCVLGCKRRKWNYFAVALLSNILIFVIRGPIYGALLEQKGNGASVINVSDSGSISILHGLVYAGIQDDLPEKTQDFLEDMMPIEEWKKYYNRYSANELSGASRSKEYQVSQKLKEAGTAGLLKEYCRVLVHSPVRLIEDRLFGIDILWNVIQDSGYDWRVANDTYEIGIVSNQMGWYRHDNYFTDIVRKLYQLSTDNKLIDSFFWRAGMWMGIFILCIFYGCIKKQRLWGYYVPVFSNIVSLCLAMAWQDFRYVYFMNLCVPYLLLLSLSDERKMFIPEGIYDKGEVV